MKLHQPRGAHSRGIDGGAEDELAVVDEGLAVVAEDADARDARHRCGEGCTQRKHEGTLNEKAAGF